MSYIISSLLFFLVVWKTSVEVTAFSPSPLSAKTKLSKESSSTPTTTLETIRHNHLEPLSLEGNGLTTTTPATRRQLLVSAASASTAAFVALGTTKSAFAKENIDSLETFEDVYCNFSIQLPVGWTKSIQSLPDRRKIVLYLPPDSSPSPNTLVFLAYTPVRDDFTSLGSFGSVDQVAQTTILPKSTLAGIEGVESKMLSAESKNKAYYFDYWIETQSQPKTHFRTIFTLANGATGGAGNVLVSITAQTPETNYETMKPLFEKIIDSFK